MHLAAVPQGVVFDMDGLLFDTEALYHRAITRAAAEIGRDIPLAVFQRMLGQPWPGNRAILSEHLGSEDAVEPLRVSWMRHYDALVLTGPPVKPGVGELLDLLDHLRMPRAIATSSGHDDVRRNLAAHGLSDRFDAVVARGDYAAGKPAPDPYLTAAARLGLRPASCLALEDSHSGIRSAAAAGMLAVMVPDMVGPTAGISALCVAVVPDLRAVAAALMDAANRTGRFAAPPDAS